MRIFQKSFLHIFTRVISISEFSLKMVLRSAASIPVYTTILGQATSACGSLFAAASVDGIIAVWRTSSLSSGKPIVRQGY